MDDLEIIYEELIHIKALSHLSTTVGCLLVEHGWWGEVLNAPLAMMESIMFGDGGEGMSEFFFINHAYCVSWDAKEVAPKNNPQIGSSVIMLLVVVHVH